MSRSFSLTLAALALTGLAILLTPYADEDTSWISGADPLNLELPLPREIQIQCETPFGLFCDELPPLRGLLGRHLEPWLVKITSVRCTEFPLTTKFGAFRFAPDSTFRFCDAAPADSTITFAIGDQGTVISLARTWLTPDPLGTYRTVAATFTDRLGEGRLCPQSDDLSVTANVRWTHDGYNEGVLLIDSTRVSHDASLGPIDCHVG